MAAPLLAEGAVTLIQDYIKANIGAALNSVRTDRADSKVVLSEPQSYFIYEDAKVYKSPAIFTICEDFNFQLSENKANHINAKADVRIAAVVEDRERTALVFKAWRYQSALHELLAQRTLISGNNKLTLTVTIRDERFSPTYSSVANKGSTESVFRKEIMLECDVIHRENY
jgi:hypothetical protein